MESLQSAAQVLLILVVVALMAVLLAILWLANQADRRRTAAGILLPRTEPAAAAAGGPEDFAASQPPRDLPALDATAPELARADLAGLPVEAAPPGGREPSPGPAAANAPATPARQAGDPGQSFAILAYALLALLYGLLFIGGVLAQAMAGLMGGATGAAAQAGIDPAIYTACGVGLWLPALIGLILLLPPVRRLIARFVPIDPRSAVHAVALAFTMMIVMNLVVGTVTLAQSAQDVQAGGDALGGASAMIALTWIQDVYLLILAAVGVGLLSRRSLGAAARRLGLTKPTGRQAIAGAVIGLLMIPVVIGLTEGAKLVGIPENTDVQKISEALIGPMTQSIIGVLTLGLAAALGEEAVFRGALQPRFGLLLTAVLFAAMHNQYAISVSTVVVLILGTVLGLVRQRANTTTSMIVHAVYNSSLGLLAYLNIMK